MADQDDSMNEEQWLYGESSVILPTSELKKEPGTEKDTEEPPPASESVEAEINQNEVENSQCEAAEPGEILKDDEPAEPKTSDSTTTAQKDDEEEEGQEDDDDDDDSEDDVHVTIGDIKTAPQYPNLNIKRGAQLSTGIDKLNKQQQGKFSIDEFESIGTINGVPAHEFSIDALEDKPWRKPGADITDYFNYGFNEDTWRAYCERQKQMRVHESGVGLGGLGVARVNPALTVVNENSKYAGAGSTVLVGGTPAPGGGPRKTSSLQGTRRSGVIDVIGSVNSRRTGDSPPKENSIQVMTDRREYSRKGFDMSVPPPGFDAPPPIPIVTSYPPHSAYNQDFYPPEMDPYYQAYEPTQEMQWGGAQMLNQVWSSRHREKKNPHSSHSLDHPKRSKYLHGNSIPKDSDMQNPNSGSITIKTEPPEKSLKERERDRESRHKESRHRHRSRSRSVDRSDRRRKHKSRSRSPGHRSHKKKKSKKSERKDNSD